MSKKASPLLIGSFVVGGLALVALALIVVAGGELFQRKERAVMYFKNSIYGLEVGAPVVFRGVRVGNVESIGVFYDKDSDDYLIPVRAELEGDAIRGLDGKRAGAAAALPELVKRGLRAQLSMQSLLTGQLYVDLDLRPDQERATRGKPNGVIEIPTTATAIQNLKNQLDGIDFRRLVDDVSAIAGSARAVLAGPELKQAMDDLAQITSNVRKLTGKVEQRFDPLAEKATGALGSTERAMGKLGAAADGVNDTARSLNTSAQQLNTLLAPDSPLVRDVRSAADQLAQTAASLRRGTAEDSQLMRNTERALQDVSRASRALKELAEMLERHPESLVRGRPANGGE